VPGRVLAAERLRSLHHARSGGSQRHAGLRPRPLCRRGADARAIYAAIIANRQAAADERSYALYRAIRCYAPAGISDCGGEEVPIAQRKAWFDQLKREYPNSQWARSLRVYW
jgi:hypothetical protein